MAAALKLHQSTRSQSVRGGRTPPADKNEQFSPIWVAAFSRDVFRASIDLDPASCPIANQVIQARRIYTIRDNALQRSWAAKSLFFNPPYGVGLISPMIEKFLEELPKIEQAIVLVNSATTARWYQALLRRCDALLLPNARINFWTAEGCEGLSPAALRAYRLNPPGGNRYDQSIFYFGSNVHTFIDRGASIGTVVIPACVR